MLYKALKTFSGIKINMVSGDIKEIEDQELVKDLLNAQYIEQVPPEKPKTKRRTPKGE